MRPPNPVCVGGLSQLVVPAKDFALHHGDGRGTTCAYWVGERCGTHTYPYGRPRIKRARLGYSADPSYETWRFARAAGHTSFKPSPSGANRSHSLVFHYMDDLPYQDQHINTMRREFAKRAILFSFFFCHGSGYDTPSSISRRGAMHATAQTRATSKQKTEMPASTIVYDTEVMQKMK